MNMCINDAQKNSAASKIKSFTDDFNQYNESQKENNDQFNIDQFLGSGNQNAFAKDSGSGGGGGCGGGGGGGGGGMPQSNKASGGSPAGGGNSSGNPSVDGSNTNVQNGANGSKTLDIDNDGKVDVSIKGANAEKLAEIVAKEAKENPKFAGMLKEAAACNENGVAEININELGKSEKGNDIAGRAHLGEEGQGNMVKGVINVDDDFMRTGEAETLDTVVHEFGHNAGYMHDAAHDAYIADILGKATSTGG